MTSIQQFEIDGQKVWVEVADVSVSTPSPGRERFANTSAGSSPASAVAKAVEKADISATLKTVVGSVQHAMAALKPDEINVELTLGFMADVGVFIASGEANAQVKVSAKWKPATTSGG